MKKAYLLSVLALLYLATPQVRGQVIVSVRPTISTQVKPAPLARRNHVWVPAHWKWSVKKNQYLLIDGYWLRKRSGHRYVAGHWIVVKRRNYKWVPGHWARV